MDTLHQELAKMKLTGTRKLTTTVSKTGAESDVGVFITKVLRENSTLNHFCFQFEVGQFNWVTPVTIPWGVKAELWGTVEPVPDPPNSLDLKNSTYWAAVNTIKDKDQYYDQYRTVINMKLHGKDHHEWSVGAGSGTGEAAYYCCALPYSNPELVALVGNAQFQAGNIIFHQAPTDKFVAHRVFVAAKKEEDTKASDFRYLKPGGGVFVFYGCNNTFCFENCQFRNLATPKLIYSSSTVQNCVRLHQVMFVANSEYMKALQSKKKDELPLVLVGGGSDCDHSFRVTVSGHVASFEVKNGDLLYLDANLAARIPSVTFE